MRGSGHGGQSPGRDERMLTQGGVGGSAVP